MSLQKNVQIKNRKAKFEYEILDKYTAGIVLKGTEIKAIREGKASIAESFCEFNDRGELFVINMTDHLKNLTKTLAFIQTYS